jgi:hypothetical protein
MRVFLLMENKSKSNNLGPLLRCAAAYGIYEVVLVGYRQCATEGSHGSASHLNIIAFPVLDQAIAYLQKKHNCHIMGLLGGAPNAYDSIGYPVEPNNDGLVQVVSTGTDSRITSRDSKDNDVNKLPRSMPIHVRPFQSFETRNCCLVATKGWKGLPLAYAGRCDSFVHVPYMDSVNNGMLLDTPATLSITLHHLTAWCQLEPRSTEGQKFDVAIRSPEHNDPFVTQQRSQAKIDAQAAVSDAFDDGGAWGDSLFPDDDDQ